MAGGSYPEMDDLAATFRAAAAALESGLPPQPPAADLLMQLGYLTGSPVEAANRAALLRAAAGFTRVFTLDAPDAPGLVALGAEVDPAVTGAVGVPPGGVSGTGLTFGDAFEACIGEGIEYLSQFQTPDDPVEILPPSVALQDAPEPLRALWARLVPDDREAAWTVAADLADGRLMRVPADLCLRRDAALRAFAPPWPLSIGCGAGPDPLAATLHGLLELIERDAGALWERGGRRGRPIPADAPAAMEAAALLVRLRGGPTPRRSWLLDVTSDLGVPVVAALSCNEDGHGLCCGLAARPTLAGAARAALLEMTQMELAWRIVQAKQATRGAAALNDADRLHMRRYTELAVAGCDLLHPRAPPAGPADLPDASPQATLAALRDRLAAAGLAPCVVNLTRPAFGVAVVRVLCPGLEAGHTAHGPRLHTTWAAAGRTGDCPGAVALF